MDPIPISMDAFEFFGGTRIIWQPEVNYGLPSFFKPPHNKRDDGWMGNEKERERESKRKKRRMSELPSSCGRKGNVHSSNSYITQLISKYCYIGRLFLYKEWIWVQFSARFVISQQHRIASSLSSSSSPLRFVSRECVYMYLGSWHLFNENLGCVTIQWNGFRHTHYYYIRLYQNLTTKRSSGIEEKSKFLDKIYWVWLDHNNLGSVFDYWYVPFLISFLKNDTDDGIPRVWHSHHCYHRFYCKFRSRSVRNGIGCNFHLTV